LKEKRTKGGGKSKKWEQNQHARLSKGAGHFHKKKNEEGRKKTMILASKEGRLGKEKFW